MSIYLGPARIVSRLLLTHAWSIRSLAALLVGAVVTAAPNPGMAQELVLTAGIGKTTFFEDEPIYLLVRLQNVGTDTAWTDFSDLLSPAVTMFVSRGHGKPVRVAKPVVDHLVRPSWRGEPVPPGINKLESVALQAIMGDEWDMRSHLFPHHLPPDQYELRVEFDAHGGVPGATPLTLEAAPIVFQVRPRRPVEEREVTELEAMRQMGWDTTRVAGIPRAAGYKAALIRWVERRLADQPDDPFLPFLLSDGLYGGGGQILWRHIQRGEVQRFDPDTSEVVSRLRLAVIEAQRLSTGGAHLVQALSARDADQLATLVETLGASPAGEMARSYVERIQHGQHVKRQPPR